MEATVQQLHPALQPGRRLTLVGSNIAAGREEHRRREDQNQKQAFHLVSLK